MFYQHLPPFTKKPSSCPDEGTIGFANQIIANITTSNTSIFIVYPYVMISVICSGATQRSLQVFAIYLGLC